MYVADLAALRGLSRWGARLLMLKVKHFAPQSVERVKRRGAHLWRARPEAVGEYLEARKLAKRALHDRIAALEERVAELEDALEEAVQRIDARAAHAPRR